MAQPYMQKYIAGAGFYPYI